MHFRHCKYENIQYSGYLSPEHYMVDITERVEIIRKMVAKGDYFCFRSATKGDACQSKNKINTIE